MRFDEFDAKMRTYEQSLDQVILKGVFMVARLDGRGFTKLTKDIMNYDKPFDIRFRDAMITTAKALMYSGFHVAYAYVQSDEISLLFHPSEDSFGRKVRKYESILAGVASAAMSLELNRIVSFDCRIIPLPDIDHVIDYFRWRREDSNRNALNGYCYWTLRKDGLSARKASKKLSGAGEVVKKELLTSKGINYDKDVPLWQKYGVGLFYITVFKTGVNPETGENYIAERRRIRAMTKLPICGKVYSAMIERITDGRL